MKIPRLVIADERREGTVPPGVVFAATLKKAGHPVRLFSAGPDEYLTRLASLVTGEDVTILTPYACGNTRVLKTLFQYASDENALNIILAPLGKRKEDDDFSVYPQGPEMSKIFDCPLIPVIAADSSSVVIARGLEKVVAACVDQGAPSIPAVLFSSVFNAREFQLLEIEAGRRTPLLSIGYIPKSLERERSTLLELSLPNMAERAALPVMTSGAQLAALPGQIDFNTLWGFARLYQNWTEVAEPLRGNCAGLTVGVVTHPGLDLEGDNARRLFSYLGCSVRKIFLEEARPALDVDALYVPHGLGFLCAEILLGRPATREWFEGLFKKRAPVFVNGGVTPLLGDSFSLPNGKEYEGMGLFRFKGRYAMPSSDLKNVEISSREGDPILNLGDKMRGYIPPYIIVLNPRDGVRSIWNVRDPATGRDRLSGWEQGNAVVTDLCIELWSNMDRVYRWLMEGR